MKFLIVTHAETYKKEDQYFAYAPYVREMNLWAKYVNQISIVSPVGDSFEKNISLAYQHNQIKFYQVSAFSLVGSKEILKTLFKLPQILAVIYKAMKQADHIHLRCPGNMGLLGCLVQVLFPKTPKTAKYAGNWNPKAKQPWSYILQKWLLSNTLLTKNMQVLVYGNWPNQTQNIKAFFTATYQESEKEPIKIRNYTQTLHFCFVGSLAPGKQPLKAIQFVQELQQKGIDAILHIYGDGTEREAVSDYIKLHQLTDTVLIYGNQPKQKVKKAIQQAHFLILPSKSEGWPKVVAEAMFWGCIPIVTPISCVPWMLDNGKRGILMLDTKLNETANSIQSLINQPSELERMAEKAAQWSRQYTLDKFEKEIEKLLAT
ncbi:glycosyltransferase family 4 protein [Psychroflexus planctonicus]|uniref:Glycosyl transferase n=1 Tax=Psychroflexus planctonicus TaxID=1526575 RepID=A0ABQ1SDZ6_9FLAO|nr:glycosyltransferase [Psychroflexus planctonicus]GGE32484.1 glycosyl transferase [Psychroflexus planctonicus]